MAVAADRAYEDSTAAPRERGLWCAVIHQALSDVLTGAESVPSGWLNSHDFRMVAELAGVDPSAARDGFLRRVDRERLAAE